MRICSIVVILSPPCFEEIAILVGRTSQHWLRRICTSGRLAVTTRGAVDVATCTASLSCVSLCGEHGYASEMRGSGSQFDPTEVRTPWTACLISGWRARMMKCSHRGSARLTTDPLRQVEGGQIGCNAWPIYRARISAWPVRLAQEFQPLSPAPQSP